MAARPRLRLSSDRLEVYDRARASQIGRHIERLALLLAFVPLLAAPLWAIDWPHPWLATTRTVAAGMVAAPTVLIWLLSGEYLNRRWRAYQESRAARAVVAVYHRAITLRPQHAKRCEVVPLENVSAGHCVGQTVVLHLADGRVAHVRTATDDTADAMLHAMARPRRKKSASFDLYAGWPMAAALLCFWAAAFPVILLASALAPRAIAALPLDLAMLAVAAAAREVLATRSIGRVIVGVDGLRVERAGRAQLVRYAEVREVVATARGATLRLHDGRQVALHAAPARMYVGEPNRGDDDRLARLRAVALRQLVTERFEAYGRGAAHPQLRASASASIDDWRRTLGDSLTGMVASYRQRTAGATEAAAVAADPLASASQRIGAALAVADVEDPAARRRVRIAAALTVDDDLRMALEEAADGVLAERTRARFAGASE